MPPWPGAVASAAKEADRDLGQSIENKRISVRRNRTACLPRSPAAIDLVVVDVDGRDVGISMGVGSPSDDVTDTMIQACISDGCLSLRFIDPATALV